MKLTRTISGQRLTLTRGIRYLATRPFATRGRTRYPITISSDKEPPRTLPDMTYDAANTFLAAFNNGKISFSGRVWK